MPTLTGVGPNGVRLVLSLDLAAQQDLAQISRYYQARLGIPACSSSIVRRALEGLKRDLYQLAGNGEDKLSQDEVFEVVLFSRFRAARPAPEDGDDVYNLTRKRA